MAVIDYRNDTIPTAALQGYAFDRGLTVDEAELRMRAVLQICGRLLDIVESGVLPELRAGLLDDDGRPVLRTVMDDVDRLTGVRPPPLGGSLHTFASWLAVQWFPGDAENVRSLPGRWWGTPLGVLCDRVLHVEG